MWNCMAEDARLNGSGPGIVAEWLCFSRRDQIPWRWQTAYRMPVKVLGRPETRCEARRFDKRWPSKDGFAGQTSGS